MFEQTVEHGFYIRSDGSFRAFIDNSALTVGTDVLKAEVKGAAKVHVWPFVAIASTPDKDREGQTLIQKGLDFSPFIEHGEFNFNHISTSLTGVPTGKKAWFENGIWKCQGEIIGGLPIAENYKTDQMVEQHNTLRKSGHLRGLCVSVEGKVKDLSKCGRFVRKAVVYNIAHTFRPQNPNCTLSMLAKAFNGETEVLKRDGAYDEMQKALGGASFAVKEDLEGAGKTQQDEDDPFAKKLIAHLVSKGMSRLKAKRHVYNYLHAKFPGK